MDLSYFEESRQVLITEAVYDGEGILVTPAVYEAQQFIRARGQHTTLADVLRVNKKRRGQPPSLLNAIISRCCETCQWEWFDRYQSHLVELDVITTHNAEFPLDLWAVPVAPIRPFFDTLMSWSKRYYSELRSGQYAPIPEQMGMIADDALNLTTTFTDHIVEVKTRNPK
jgi:hypothetical protein